MAPVTNMRYVFSLRRPENEDLWFSLVLYDTLYDGGLQVALCNSSGSGMNNGLGRKVPLRFHDWFHACVSLNASKGQVVAVVNGFVAHNFQVQSTRSDVPIVFKGKLRVGLTEIKFGKSQVSQEQSTSPVTNINIFSGLLNVQDMKKQTGSVKCANGTYLKWVYIEWDLKGKVAVDKQERDICHSNPFNTNLVLTTLFPHWEDCVKFCPKLQLGEGCLL